MLKALLWKEWRETRLFFLIMALIIFIFSFLVKNLDYVKETKAYLTAVLYILTWVFFSVLTAASQFAGEEESGTVDFLLSRPVHRIKIWFLKTLYGASSLVLFGLFLLLMSVFFITPFLESAAIFDIFFKHAGGYIGYSNSDGVILCLSIFVLYFLGCTVSINIKSSFKSVLVTFLAAFCLFIVLSCSYPEFYFKASQYIFWIIFPIFMFIIFIKYQPESPFTRIIYLLLPIGGILIWIVTAIKGGSLWTMSGSGINHGILTRTSPIFDFPLLTGVCLSGIVTSLFAFGISPRGFQGWWKYLGCWNFLTILAISLSAFITLLTPLNQVIRSGFNSIYINYSYYQYYLNNGANSNLPFAIEKSHPLKGNRLVNYRQSYERNIVSEQYFILDRDKGKVIFYGRDNFLMGNFHRISGDNRWVIYTAPDLKWGTYYKLELWAENLDTAEQYQLMTLNKNNAISGEWFDGGKRFIFNNYDGNSNKQSLILFSVTNGEPRKLKEIQTSPSCSFIFSDNKERLYFLDTSTRLISCYNHDLVKEYDITAMQEKYTEFESEFKQNGYIRVYTSNPFISRDGEFMIFIVRGNYRNRNTEKKKGPWGYENQGWYISLPDGAGKKLDDIDLSSYYYRFIYMGQHPVEEHLIIDTVTSKSDDKKLILHDIKNGTTKTLLEDLNCIKPGRINVHWGVNGKYFLAYCSYGDTRSTTVSLFAFDSKDRSCKTVSSKPNLEGWKAPVWSSRRSHVAFRSEDEKEIWVIDMVTGKWSKIVSTFNKYYIQGVSNEGEVYITPEGKTQIYRLANNEEKIIF
ncbi:ABC transporter permease [Thermodesulfobacteriota bacterium]